MDELTASTTGRRNAGRHVNNNHSLLFLVYEFKLSTESSL